ncbi:hypothetical protein OAJ75_01965 [Candidatus Pelagibacter sp.]|nr:hypothetical protein [Candidatus Pelagibacter sp.]
MYKLLKKKKKYHLKNHQFTNLISINNLKKFKLKIPTVKQSIKKFILI